MTKPTLVEVQRNLTVLMINLALSIMSFIYLFSQITISALSGHMTEGIMGIIFFVIAMIYIWAGYNYDKT